MLKHLITCFVEEFYVSSQSLLYASPSKDPRSFLGTLPCPAASKDDKSQYHNIEQEKGLRIARQYKKYMGENQPNFDCHRDNKQDYCNEFDLWKPLERHYLTGQHVDCCGIKDSKNVSSLQDCCATFLAQFQRNDGSSSLGGRIAIQSFCAPQCEHSNTEWTCFHSLNLSKVPVILEVTTYTIKLQKRRYLVLECLNQAPVDGSSGSPYGTTGSCSGSSKIGTVAF